MGIKQSLFRDHVNEIAVSCRTALGSINHLLSSNAVPDKTELPERVLQVAQAFE